MELRRCTPDQQVDQQEEGGDEGEEEEEGADGDGGGGDGALYQGDHNLEQEKLQKGRIESGHYGLAVDWSEINEKVKILEISKSSQHFETTLPL